MPRVDHYWPTPNPADAMPSQDATPSPDNPQRRAVRRVLIVTLLIHIAISGLKLAFGYHANIVSLQADGFHSLFDALSNIIGLVALGLAMQPPDPEHPYGHQKIEVAASLTIGIMILLGLIEVGRAVLSAAVGDTVPSIGVAAYAVVLVTIAASLTISIYERRAAKRHNSMILESDADHTLSDALAGFAVLIGMALVSLGIPAGDIFAALAVMLFIGMTAYRVLRSGLDVVVDASLLDADAVCRVTESIDAVRSCHYVRNRGMPGRVHLDLHITLDPNMRLDEAGQILLQVKARLHDHFTDLDDVLIQIEPHKPIHYQDVPENLR